MIGKGIKPIHILACILVVIGCASCSITTHVPDGEYLLDKVHIKTDTKDLGRLELLPYVRQIPNTKMLLLFRTQLWIYSRSGQDTTKWLNRVINRQLRRMGEAPVIYDSTLVYKTNTELTRLLVNMGYMNVDVQSETISRKKKKMEVTYDIKANEPYRIHEYTSDIPDTAIYKELYGNNGRPRRITGEPASLRNPLVYTGMLFDRNILDSERNRITNLLRNRGYYAFSKDYITYDADTSLHVNAVDLMLRLHLYPEFLPNGDFAEIPHRKYYIDKVFIYTEYDPLRVANEGEKYLVRDSITNGKYTIYFPGKSLSMRSGTLMAHNFLIPGRPYSQLREETTYSAFSNLPAISNIQLSVEETHRNDSSFLNCHILTMPTRKQTVSFSVEGTNSAGDFGVGSSVEYTHRNIFKGSELLNVRLRGAYESISDNFSQNYLDFGVETSLRFPQFLFPFISNTFKRRTRASTEFSLGYNYQTRPEYDRTLLSGGVKYLWQSRAIGEARHQVNLIDINYISVPRLDSSFVKKLPPDAVFLGYTNQFIVGTSYIYSHSTFNPFQKQRNAYSLRASAESAGNTLFALSKLFNMPKNKESGYYELLGVPFAQYVKGDIDYSRTTFIDRHNSIAWRAGVGLAFPYGNDLQIPFEKRYYSGGANSVRGWAVRSLGPGKYVPNDSTTFYNQAGDIKLDLSLEYRTRFFWKFELATYIDAGNIWTIRDYAWQPGGQFKFNSFYKEIAMSYGVGLRLDFDFFLIRFDTGFKGYNPEKEGRECWAILRPNFRDNFAWHFAVGYPF